MDEKLSLVGIDTVGERECFCFDLSPSVSEKDDMVVALEYLIAEDCIVVCMRSGDIINVELGKREAECVGTVDSGALGMGWSEDGELVVFATGNGTLFSMNKSWVPLAEVPIREGEKARPTHFAMSWEGTAERFVTNTQFEDGSYHMGIWSRDCALLAACEQIKQGCAPCVAFRPSGFLVASSFVDSSSEDMEHGEVALFESNGLRHGEFSLQRSQTATQLCWSADSSYVAVLCMDHLQIWRTSNYVWHLSFEVYVGGCASIVKCLQNKVIVASSTTRSLKVYRFVRDICCSSQNSISMNDQSCACVIEGKTARITSFQRKVVPPPMAENSLSLKFVPCSTSFLSTDRFILFVAVAPDGRIASFELSKEDRSVKRTIGEGRLKGHGTPYAAIQVACLNEEMSLVLRTDALILLEHGSGKSVHEMKLEAECNGQTRLYCNHDTSTVLLIRGKKVFRVKVGENDAVTTEILGELEEHCAFISTFVHEKREYLVARSSRFKLWFVALDDFTQASLLESECTSFAIHAGFVVYTTLQSRIRFAPIGSKLEVDTKHDREVELNSLLVTCIPRGARTIVEAPRGNLETIYPRPLVHLASQKLMASKNYGRALELMRKHKLDLSLMVSDDFLTDCELFVKDVHDSDRLCLFLTQVGESSVCDEQTINRVCEGCRDAMLKQGGEEKFIFAILTSFVQQKPPKIEQALKVIVSMRQKEAKGKTQVVYSIDNPRIKKSSDEKALDYLTFLVPVDQLFDHALGMYDFELVTVIAKKAQKDPREYLPFLEGLKKLSGPRMRHAVDVKLERWKSALANLSEEEAALDECIKLVRDKRLYNFALQNVFLDKESKGRKETLAAFGEYLAAKGHHVEASVCFRRAGWEKQEKEAYLSSGDWAMGLFRSNFDEGFKNACLQMLKVQHRWEESVRLSLYKEKNPELAQPLFEAQLWSEALLLGCPKYQEKLEGVAVEFLSKVRGSIVKFLQYLERLRKLRVDRENWEAVEAGGQTANPSEYTDITNLSTMSGATSSSSLASLALGREKRRARDASGKKTKKTQKVKRLTGKPGSMHEEEWLVKELRALIPTRDNLSQCHNLLKVLLYADLDKVAMNIQEEQFSFNNFVDSTLEDLIAPATIFGMDGLKYAEHWRPLDCNHVVPAKEFEGTTYDESILKPKFIVPRDFVWKLVLLEKQE